MTLDRRTRITVRRLEAERARLAVGLSVAAPVIGDWERPGLGTHMADSASAVFEQAKNAAVHKCLSNTMEEIDSALHKVEHGTYGSCERCGEAIDPERLRALPYAAMCVTCQGRLESTARLPKQ